MGTRQTTFGKLERERAKKAKAAAKRARRQGRGTDLEGEMPEGDAVETATRPNAVGGESEAELLKRIEAVHERYDAGMISFIDFEAEKTELLDRLALLPTDEDS